jgi:hypothetical protein
MRCDRCKEEFFRLDKCNSCNRKICNNCIKSTKNLSKTERVGICKDCWSDLKKRSKYKSYFVFGRRRERE